MQWLYKATDTENESGHRRPDFDATSGFALRDGILCRSAFSRRTHRRVNLVWSVAVGDVIHFYHRQYAPPQKPRLVGSFRVKDPGDARFDPDCALAVVTDRSLSERLRAAYDIPSDEPVTGWSLEPAPEIAPPAENDEQLQTFLAERNTLSRYLGSELPQSPPSDFTVRGFRCFDLLEIPHLGRLNLVTGKNNTGKTTLLEALRVYASAASPDDISVMLDVRGESADHDAAAALATIFGEEATAEAMKKTCTLGPRGAPLDIKLRRYRQDHGKRWVESRDRSEGEFFLVVEGPGLEERVRVDWASLRNPTAAWQPLRPSFFVGLGGVSMQDMDTIWQQAVLDGDDAAVIEALQTIEPTVARLAFVRDARGGPPRAHVAFQGGRKPRPLNALGAGVHRFLGLLLACHGARGGLLLVDEIDTGLHYSVQTRLWELLAAWSAKFDVQIVATTHSLDCVRAFAEVARRDNLRATEQGAAPAQVIRLGRRGTGPLQAFIFDEPDAFEMVSQDELEVR
ncbi:MAG TPA: ATP-binding protein [Candidatus Nanopelagicales bacterium]|nr:ATP-binding protein [Candidatus Nanopelagicales bacterium]